MLGIHIVFGLVAFFLGIARGFCLYMTIMGDVPGAPLFIMTFGDPTWPNEASVAFFIVLGIWLDVLSLFVLMLPLMGLWILALALLLNGSWYLLHNGAYIVFRFVQSLYISPPQDETFEMELLNISSAFQENAGTIISRSLSN